MPLVERWLRSGWLGYPRKSYSNYDCQLFSALVRACVALSWEERSQNSVIGNVIEMTAQINFVLNNSKNYLGVQDRILMEIKKHLPGGSWRESINQYVEGCLNFTLFIAKEADVLMSHGLADKNYHWKRDRKQNRYNQVRRRSHLLVPGNWLKDRIVRSKSISFGDNQVHVVGWPRLDTLLAESAERRTAERRPFAGRRPKVLWAPTHDFNKKGKDQVTTSSYPEFEQYLPILEEKFDVDVSLHPRNRPSKEPTETHLLDADYVISDFGTLVYEAWALGKPVIFPHWIIGERIVKYLGRSAEAHIFRNQIGYHASSISHLMDILSDGPVVDDQVIEFLGGYLEPAYLGCSGRRVAEVLLELAGAKPSGTTL